MFVWVYWYKGTGPVKAYALDQLHKLDMSNIGQLKQVYALYMSCLVIREL